MTPEKLESLFFINPHTSRGAPLVLAPGVVARVVHTSERLWKQERWVRFARRCSRPSSYISSATTMVPSEVDLFIRRRSLHKNTFTTLHRLEQCERRARAHLLQITVLYRTRLTLGNIHIFHVQLTTASS